METIHCRPAGAAATRIRVHRGIRERLLHELPSNHLVVVDQGVAATWPELMDHDALLPHGGGEANKTMAGLESLLRELARRRLDRSAVLVAVGGGALGDLVGLTGALWLRGIQVWQVPTTLLAMVDAAVGGKTAVDLPEGKNLVGAVHPPTEVLVDPHLLTSLPEEQFRSGLAEVLKMAVGIDPGLFQLLEDHAENVLTREPGPLDQAIHRCIARKAEVVAADLDESGPRRTLNLGHTIGHAVEAHAGGRIPHGICVADGLHGALALARGRGSISPTDHDRCVALLVRFGFLPPNLPPWGELLPFLQRDKKIHGDVLHWVLPTGVGRCRTEALPVAALAGGLDALIAS